MIIDFFKKNKYVTISTTSFEEERKVYIPNNHWVKCNKCSRILYKEDIKDNYMVCPFCEYHFRLDPRQRIEYLVDENSFEEFDVNFVSNDPLKFPDYENKIASGKEKSNENDALVCGKCKIGNNEIILCIMNSYFMMGSMGSVVGEKITRSIEKAIELKLPVIIVTSSGGARMQEGMFSLMQMAKISGALQKLSENNLLYLTVITDPTTGGVTASFAMLGDIIISEPGALIGFAGRRVIEKTINESLPEDFQTAEFLLEKGFLDKIVHRKDMKNFISYILKMHRRYGDE